MIKGEYDKDIFSRDHCIVVYDEERQKAWTFEVKEHDIIESGDIPTSRFKYRRGEDHILKGLAEALQKGQIMPESATDSELRATKYHLEDMRKLGLG